MTQAITELTAHQYGGIVGTATIRPDGPGLIVIAGPNGSGKSSFLNGIEEIFAPGGIKGTPKPIHDGETEAYLEVVTSKARLRKTYREGKAMKFEVWALDGAKYPSGPAFVLEAAGGQSFNTKTFINLDAPKQREVLLSKVALPFDLAKLEAEHKAAYDGRTDAAREAKRLTAVVEALVKPAAGTPTVEVSATAVLAEAETARLHNAHVDRLRAAAINAENAKSDAEREVARLSDLLDAAKTFLLTATEVAATTLAEARTVRPVNVDAITAKLASVEETNATIRAARAWHDADERATAANAVVAGLNAKLEAIAKTKSDGLKAAVFPITGMSVDDTGITIDGIPFKQQVNSAAKIITAFDLATSDKSDLRLVFIEDGDMLDAVSLAGIRKLAIEREYYVIVERDRDDSRELGAVFTAGELAA
ncbi:hypothetical protein [Cryobacterium sp. GrIS_2_6]|uniref:hypothetical protein n=1 Tax=Cryobacterium sp. GrIS_2_6 TaxID=3162785 RepID=UPI002E074AF1|nr:ABC-type cobalamin/Fe3+-siderophores transport system ATPase subunit [Cryobacterium psychrotolerans]MEC5149273.1 ABC-type cobalamin/Fe3+-siderophores transport system ATPase subunit [Cryobacterium psychrotolerans]MEC5149352.1 ABC-type cobalamin/Fe3+-siderophores transport system ATPase subunit [Cryobacterium psychrotolerans]